MRTHPFTSVDGRLVRIIEPAPNLAFLETSNGNLIGPCAITGPEILKLAEQGRTLWNALRDALEYGYPGAPEGRRVLEATAPTFDHNERGES